MFETEEHRYLLLEYFYKCKEAANAIETSIQVIDSIQSIDMSQWLKPQKLPRFDSQISALSAGSSQ